MHIAHDQEIEGEIEEKPQGFFELPRFPQQHRKPAAANMAALFRPGTPLPHFCSANVDS